MDTIIAVYEGGVFRPLSPVTLPEHARVRIVPVTGDLSPDVENYHFTPEQVKEHPLLAILGIAETGQVDDTSEHDEEVLYADAHAIHGWSVNDGENNVDNKTDEGHR